MMPVNPVFQFPGFGIYFLELGKYFKDKFQSFKIFQNGDEINCQVFFGTPRAAFRFFQKRFNGLMKLPLINYHNTSMTEKPEFERPNAWVYSQKSYNPITKTYETMKAPKKFEISYSVVLWNNTYRERDYMIHAMLNDFKQGLLNLAYYPDINNYPDAVLIMPIKLDGSISDETEIEGLEPTQTRDNIKTSFTLTGEAFLPYESYQVNATEWIGVNLNTEDINDFLGNTIYAPDLLHPQIKLLIQPIELHI